MSDTFDYRALGRTGLKVSPLGLGTMSFGNEADESTSKVLYNRCREAGINLFDCADVYAKGRSELILGKLIASERDEVVLTSKAYFPTGPGPNARGSSRYHLVNAVEASLTRLGTDRIDLFFLHRYDDETDLEETLRALEDLVRAGKILYPAVSNFSAWQTMKGLGIQRAQGYSPFVALQPMYNLVKRQAEVELLPMAESEGLGVFPYSPLAAGLLTGKYGEERRPESGRVVDNPMYATRYGRPADFSVAERFTKLSKKRGLHPVSLAIAWVAAHPAVTAPLLGARNLEQLEPALEATRIPMDDELYRKVSALSPEPPPATDRNEERTGDNYAAQLEKK
jgi:aryl-alcohol dehydrogenase-like predicted oxidoreductase